MQKPNTVKFKDGFNTVLISDCEHLHLVLVAPFIVAGYLAAAVWSPFLAGWE